MAKADLHTHSTASDGTDAPGDLARLARDRGLSCFALTDHDTTAGLEEAAAAAKKLKVTFVPGIELSASPDLDAAGSGNVVRVADEDLQGPADLNRRGNLHLLGYHIRQDAPGLTRIARQQQRAREERNPAIIEKLQSLGVSIDYDEVLEAAGGENGTDLQGVSVGRPHIAQVLMTKGYVKSIHEAFLKYLGVGGAAYTRRDRLSAMAAIEAIHAAGGVAVLAHPVQMALDHAGVEHAVARLTTLGLDGLETRHSDHEPADVHRLTALADRYDLIPTGGSDYHGSRKAIQLGDVVCPDQTLERLARAAEAYR
ncbi:MAG: PHP domain-containing protein [Planctomycetota bacterium]